MALPRPTATLVIAAPFQLDFQQPARALTVEEGPIGAVVVDSMLTHTLPLALGVTVGHLELRDEENLLIRALPLRHGIETGEWSKTTGSAQVALTWIAPGGPSHGGRLGRTYRHRWEFEEPIAATRLRWVRNPRLPAEVTLVIRRVEAAP
jgi:hypothetical protein